MDKDKLIEELKKELTGVQKQMKPSGDAKHQVFLSGMERAYNTALRLARKLPDEVKPSTTQKK